MLELTDPNGDLYDIHSKQDFLSDINRYLKEKKLYSTQDKNYSILYNCTCKTRFKKLKSFGFKHVFTYQGVEKVKVLILEVNRKPWYKRLFNI